MFVDEAARGFSVLADSGKPKGKGRPNHLVVKLLHAQKLWSSVLPKLIEGEKEAEGAKRLVYLVAFASLLPLVPSTVLLSNLPTVGSSPAATANHQLLPLLLRSLSLPNPAQRANVITTLTSILETANSSTATDTLLHEQAEAIVDGFLKSALREEGVETSGVSVVEPCHQALLTARAGCPLRRAARPRSVPRLDPVRDSARCQGTRCSKPRLGARRPAPRCASRGCGHACQVVPVWRVSDSRGSRSMDVCRIGVVDCMQGCSGWLECCHTLPATEPICSRSLFVMAALLDSATCFRVSGSRRE